MKDINSQDPMEPIIRVGRRPVLKAALIGGAALAAGVGGMASWLSTPVRQPVPLPAGLQILNPDEYQLLQRLVDVLLPQEGSGLFPSEQVAVVENFDLIVNRTAYYFGILRHGIRLLDYSPLVTGYGCRLVDLEDRQLLSLVADWGDGNMIQRAVIGTIRRLLFVSYWRDERTWEPVGYDGPVSDKWGLQALGYAPMPEEFKAV